VELSARLSPGVSERFWSKVDRSGGPNACWPWTAGLSSRRYGKVKIGGKSYGAHRVAMLLAGTDLPAGAFACHRCDNERCCNPTHLFAGTPKENMHDKIRKGRATRGSDVVGSKLTEDQVHEIRAAMLMGATQRGIARLYGIDQRAAYSIQHGLTWVSRDV
jgi:hypothetical protein